MEKVALGPVATVAGGVVHLFPNGTSKVEDAFLAAYKHFEHTCVHSSLALELLGEFMFSVAASTTSCTPISRAS